MSEEKVSEKRASGVTASVTAPVTASCIAIVRHIVTCNKEGAPLKSSYAVAWSKQVKGPITFSLILWKESYELRVGDEVRLESVHSRSMLVSGRQTSGWRAEIVKPVSPQIREPENKAETKTEKKKERRMFWNIFKKLLFWKK